MSRPYHSQLCLVSAQATPNLLPVLDNRWRPQRVILGTTPEMRDASKALASVLLRNCPGLTVETLGLEDAYDYTALWTQFCDFLLREGECNIALNVTGGTKIMAVAAQDVFTQAGKAAFYVNVSTDEVIALGERGRSEPLVTNLKVGELLRAHGLQVDLAALPQVKAAMRDVCARLIDNSVTNGHALGLINSLARQAINTPNLEVPIDKDLRYGESFRALVNILEDAGLLHEGNGRMSFPNESARAFVNGGWLELHVYQTLRNLEPKLKFSDVTLNVKIVNSVSNTRNEIDVAFLHRNTLFMIECKSANLGGTGISGDEKATEVIYKMESLLKLGGIRTRGLIVDYRGKLSASKANMERARQARISVISGVQLRRLSEHIEAMVRSTS
jgi:hypothetical protein